MDDNLLQVYGRLTAHEFFIEVTYANWFASLPEEAARELSSDLRKRMRGAYSAPSADHAIADAHGLQIAKDAATMADLFLQKVEKREAEIRAKYE